MNDEQREWTVKQCMKLAMKMVDLQGQEADDDFWRFIIDEVDRIHEKAKRNRTVADALVVTIEFIENLQKAVCQKEVLDDCKV